MNELLRIGFLAFTWIDLVDVLLITVLFYVVYHTLRDTLAVQILIVLGLVLILSFVTDAAGMKALSTGASQGFVDPDAISAVPCVRAIKQFRNDRRCDHICY
ncbi:MAG: hypothetical protein IPF59_13080 [Ignavibacteria bacterium]|nr:hypothetical protein [Ignavibacteria bacterium]